MPVWCSSSRMSQFRVSGALGVLSAYDAVCFGRCAALKVETARMYPYQTSSLHAVLHQTTALMSRRQQHTHEGGSCSLLLFPFTLPISLRYRLPQVSQKFVLHFVSAFFGHLCFIAGRPETCLDNAGHRLRLNRWSFWRWPTVCWRVIRCILESSYQITRHCWPEDRMIHGRSENCKMYFT